MSIICKIDQRYLHGLKNWCLKPKEQRHYTYYNAYVPRILGPLKKRSQKKRKKKCCFEISGGLGNLGIDKLENEKSNS